MLVVSSSESDQEIKLIEIQYETMVLNMVYQIPEGIRDCPILTGHMSIKLMMLDVKDAHFVVLWVPEQIIKVIVMAALAHCNSTLTVLEEDACYVRL